MKFLTWAVISIFGVTMLVAMHQLISLMVVSHGWDGLKPADWAAWVQAFGSIAAIGAALILANLQRRQNDIERADLAILAAADVQIRQQAFQAHIEQVLAYLRGTPIAEVNYGFCVHALEKCGTFSMEDLKPLIPVKGRVAALMATCSRTVETCISGFRDASNRARIANNDAEIIYRNKAIDALENCLDSINAAIKGCRDHVSKHAGADRD